MLAAGRALNARDDTRR